MPAARSGTTSCTAPNAWLAMPHSRNAPSTAHVSADGAACASASPYTAGLTKCTLDVSEASAGTSLNRNGGAEDGTSPNRLTASTAHGTSGPATADATPH